LFDDAAKVPAARRLSIGDQIENEIRDWHDAV
jgi:hypothetical protein